MIRYLLHTSKHFFVRSKGSYVNRVIEVERCVWVVKVYRYLNTNSIHSISTVCLIPVRYALLRIDLTFPYKKFIYILIQIKTYVVFTGYNVKN